MHLNFSPLTMTGEQTFSPKELQGKWSILYFYPRDATPGCTQEGQDFRDAYTAFQALNCSIYGISRDSINTHERFKNKHQFPFELISDSSGKLCQYFDVIKEKKLFGKIGLGILRSTFIINPQGEVVREWRKVKVAGHVKEVLEALKSLMMSSS